MASFLIKDVRIFTGTTTIENGSVLVENGHITQVSSTPPKSYSGTTLSKPGHTLLPGLIDAHVHLDGANPVALPQALRFGSTTVCDMHNEPHNIRTLFKQLRDQGDSVCADFKTTQFGATIDGGWPMAVVTAFDKSEKTAKEVATWPKLVTAEDGKRHVIEMAKEEGGLDYVKLMHESGLVMGMKLPHPPIELQRAIVEQAHAQGLKAVAHATCLADTIEILGTGVDGLTHTFTDQPPNEEVIAAYKKNGAHCNPTLAAMGSLTTEGKAMQEKFAHDERVKGLLGEVERERMCHCMGFSANANVGARVENAYESVRQLKKAGLEIVCGSDSAGPAVGTAWGLSMHHEMALYVKHCGFSPAEALRSATYVPAARFGFSDRGQIKEGLRADLLLVEGNPLEDLDNTLNLRGVWKKGILCKTYEGKV